MLLDIIVLPPAGLRRKIGKKIKAATKGMKTVFVVDNKKLIPHLSLFHIRTSKDRISNLESRLKKILKEYHPILIRSVRVELSHGESTVLFIKTSSSAKLKQLRAEVLDSCYPLRTGMMPWMIGSRNPTRSELQARKRYGTHFGFYPHITAAMLREAKDADKVAKKMQNIRFRFLADTVAICEVNFWHQVTRIIKIIKLK